MSKHRHETIVVTGASSGIGRACALRFAAEDTALVLVARREEALETLATECRGRGAEVLVAPADVTDVDAVEEIARRAVTSFGRIDVWVNNAAVTLYGAVEECPAELWRRVVETNVFGTYHGTRAVLPWMREQGQGVLINVSSIAAGTGVPQQSAYAVSKHGIRALSDCVRQEVHDVKRISVCTILPGPVDTPLFRSAANWSGRRPVPPARPISAERVATAVVRCARRPHREVAVGGGARAALFACRLFPGLVERITARAVPRAHFTHEPAGYTAGNLFEPAPFTGRVDDGWRDGRQDGDRQSGGARRTAVRLGGLAVAGGLLAAVAVTVAKTAKQKG